MHRIGVPSSISLKNITKNGFQQRERIAKMSTKGIDRRSKVSLVVAGTAVVAGGVIASAKVSPAARNWIESNVPGSQSLFDATIGQKEDFISKQTSSSKVFRKPDTSSENSLLKKKLERDAVKKTEAESQAFPIASETVTPSLKLNIPQSGIVASTGATSTDPPSEIPTPSVTKTNDITDDKSSAPEVATVNVPELESPPVQLPEPVTPAELPVLSTATSNEETVDRKRTSEIQEKPLEAILKDLELKASAAVREAVEAQDSAAIAIRRHTDLVYIALDRAGDPTVSSAEAFGPVAEAGYAKLDAVKNAEAKLQTARDTVAELKELVASGVKNRLLIKSPDLIMADEAAARALYKLESARAKVQAAKADAKIMDEYRDLIEKARSELQMELSSILPEVSPSAKDAKLNEEELNMLMAHAYRKIVALQRELARQQTLEQQRFLTALESQRQEDLTGMDTRVRAELEKQQSELTINYNKQIAGIQRELEGELHAQLKRQAAAHAEHVTDLLASQEKELSRKFTNHLQDALTQAQLSYESKMAGMIGHVKGIETALKGRVQSDVTFYRAQRLWSACQALAHAVTMGAGTAKTWEEQVVAVDGHVDAIKTAADGDDVFVSALLNGIPEDVKQRGVLPLSALKERFLAVERVARRVALIGEDGGSLVRYLLSYLQSMFVVSAALLPPAVEKQVDVEALNAFDILVRAKYSLEKDDLEQAIRYVNLLRGEPRNVALDWLKEARLSLEVRQTAEALLTYASVSGVEVL